MKKLNIIFLILTPAFCWCQYFYKTYPKERTATFYSLINHKNSIIISTGKKCELWECSEVSSFDYLGSPLWNTEFIHTDAGSTTLLSLNDTIYVGGNYNPGQGKSVINRMTLDGKVIDEHVYSDPLNRISSSLINFLYSDNKVIFFSGLGYVGDGGKALIYAISKSMNLSKCYVDTTIDNSVVWDAHVGPDSLLTCFIMENSTTAPRDRRRIEKYDRNLNLVWKYSPRDSLLLFNNIRLYGTVLNNGSIFYTYYNPINTSSLPSFRLLDTVSKSTVWQYDFSNNNKHNRLVLRSKQLDNQDILISGQYSNIGVEPPIRDAPWMMRIDINGNRVWEHVYVERQISNVNKLGALWDAIELENGDIMACGFVTNNNKWDPLLIRTDADGCIDQGQANCPTVQIIDLMSGAVDEIGQATVSIFPNPTSGIIQISQSVQKIQVFNQLGTLVLSKTNTNEVDLSDLEAGMYIISLSNYLGITSSHKVIKID